MEGFGILLGLIFWPIVILSWVYRYRFGNLAKDEKIIGTTVICVVFAFVNLPLAFTWFIDEPLYIAAAEGDVKKAEILLALGASPNFEFNGRYPLVSAASNGHTEMVLVLLEHHAWPHVRDEWNGLTPLAAAKKNNHPEIVRALREAGALK